MKFRAEIDIMPLEELLDPQGKTVQKNLPHVGIKDVSKVRVGKHITLEFQAENEEEAKKLVDQACKKILCNVIMESYTYTLHS